MSQWHMSLSEAEGLTEWQIQGLLGGYVGRLKYEAKVIVSTLGEAMTPHEEESSLAGLSAMGIGIRGA